MAKDPMFQSGCQLVEQMRELGEIKETWLHLLTNHMTINIYMFGAFMKTRISYNMSCRLIITVQRHKWNAKVLKKILEPLQFTYSGGQTLYSASVEERDTIICFLEHQEIRESTDLCVETQASHCHTTKLPTQIQKKRSKLRINRFVCGNTSKWINVAFIV